MLNAGVQRSFLEAGPQLGYSGMQQQSQGGFNHHHPSFGNSPPAMGYQQKEYHQQEYHQQEYHQQEYHQPEFHHNDFHPKDYHQKEYHHPKDEEDRHQQKE